MKIVRTKNLEGTDRDVKFNAGRSIRLILKKDNMGFSLHKTLINKGGPYHWHYTNHLEACYCISGSGVITDLKTEDIYKIVPGSTYILDNHDDHTFTAYEDTVLMSIFNPPCTGFEIHKEDGSYDI